MIINISKINLSGCSGGGGGDSKVISTKNFEVTANGTTNIVMDQGVDGISAGTITTNVQPTLTAATFDQNGTYTPGSGVDGFNSVTVNVDGAENRLNKFFTDQVTAITQSDLSGLTSINEYCFYQRSSLKTVDLPSSVNNLKQRAFNTCSSLETIDTSKVKTFGAYCFQSCTTLTSIDMSSATTIGDGCFQGCTALTTVTGLGSSTSFGGDFPSNFFDGCTSLSGDLVVNMTSNRYGSTKVFGNCRSLNSITYLKNQQEIGGGSTTNNQFAGCTSMQYLDLTYNTTVANLRHLGAFTAFTQNYEIRVPQVLYDSWTAATNWSNSAIVDHIVAYPNKYEVATIKYTTTDNNDITPRTGYDSTHWKGSYLGSEFDPSTGGTVSFYGPTLEIPGSAFSGRTTMRTLEISGPLTIILYSAFNGCSSLESISLPETLTMLDSNAFGGCTSLTGVTIPNGVTNSGLNNTAFYGCSGLTEVVFGDGITGITSNSGPLKLLQASSRITAVTFGSNFSLVSENPFSVSQNVTTLTFKSTTPPTITSAFWLASSGTVYCPAEAVSEYTAWVATVPSLSSGWTVTAIS